MTASLLNENDDVLRRVQRLVDSKPAVPVRVNAWSATTIVITFLLLVLVTMIPFVKAQSPDDSGDDKTRAKAVTSAETVGDAIAALEALESVSYHRFLRQASRLIQQGCEKKEWAEVTEALDDHSCPVTDSRDSDGQFSRTYLVKKAAFRLSDDNALDLNVTISSKKNEETVKPGKIESAEVFFVDNVDGSYRDAVVNQRYPLNSVLDHVLRCDEVMDEGSRWPLLKRVTVTYGWQPNRREEFLRNGFGVTVEFAATKDDKVGGQRLYFRVPSGLDPEKNIQGAGNPNQQFVSQDTIGEIASNGGNEWWHGEPEVVKENKKKYLIDNRQVFGIGDGGSNWSDKVPDPVPGIDAASVSVIRLFAGPPEGVPFVVWSDLCNSRGGNGTGSGKGHAFYDGKHRAGEKSIDFHAETNDGKTGVITIAGKQYDLSSGAVFLVSTQSDQPIVKQFKIDANHFPKNGHALVKLAKSNPLIGSFFTKHKR